MCGGRAEAERRVRATAVAILFARIKARVGGRLEDARAPACSVRVHSVEEARRCWRRHARVKHVRIGQVVLVVLMSRKHVQRRRVAAERRKAARACVVARTRANSARLLLHVQQTLAASGARRLCSGRYRCCCCVLVDALSKRCRPKAAANAESAVKMRSKAVMLLLLLLLLLQFRHTTHELVDDRMFSFADRAVASIRVARYCVKVAGKS